MKKFLIIFLRKIRNSKMKLIFSLLNNFLNKIKIIIKNNKQDILPFLLCIQIFTFYFGKYIPRTPLLTFMNLSILLKLIILIIVIIKIAKKDIKLVNSKENFYILGFGIIAIFSSLFAINMQNSLIALKLLGQLFVTYFLIIHLINSKKTFKWLIWTLVLIGFFIAVIAIYNQIINVQAVRAISLIEDPNDLATFLVSIIPICFFLIRNKTVNLKKLIISASILLSFIIVYGVIIN